MDYRKIADERCRALFAAWTTNPLVLVSAESGAELSTLLAGRIPGGRRTGLTGVSARLADATLITSADPAVQATLWVPAGLRSPYYRDAFRAFLGEIYGGTCGPADLPGYDIDHLLNKKRAPSGAVLIRVEAIPAAVNQAWGRLFEKNASNPNFDANRRRATRTMSWTIAAKISGQMPPTNPSDTAGIARVANFFSGFPALELGKAEIADGLTDMLTFAYKFSGGG